nr:MAG TPA: hypothetical protein [Caudoviricetes sp.]
MTPFPIRTERYGRESVAPGKDQAVAGGNPLPRARQQGRREKFLGAYPAMFTGQINRRKKLPARGEAGQRGAWNA